jgi:hypothetical protein
MNYKDKISKVIDAYLKPSKPVFKIQNGYNGNSVVICSINTKTKIASIPQDEEHNVIAGLVEENQVEFFCNKSFRYKVNKESIINSSLKKVLIEVSTSLYSRVCPNSHPHLTKNSKALSKLREAQLSEDIENNAFSIWLYSRTCCGHEVDKNIYGLLCLLADKIRRFKAKNQA